MNETLKAIGDFFRSKGFFVALGIVGVVALVAFAGGAFGAAPEAKACANIADTRVRLEAQQPTAKMVRHLTGKDAADLAKALRADFEASDVLLYVLDGHVYVAAFVGGCFKGVGGPIPLPVFLSLFPGVLPEAK